MKVLKALIPKGLVEELDQRFPERCPRETDSERAIWVYVGIRSLVRFLKEQYEAQQDKLF
jgi:hypothetical protein